VFWRKPLAAGASPIARDISVEFPVRDQALLSEGRPTQREGEKGPAAWRAERTSSIRRRQGKDPERVEEGGDVSVLSITVSSSSGGGKGHPLRWVGE